MWGSRFRSWGREVRVWGEGRWVRVWGEGRGIRVSWGLGCRGEGLTSRPDMVMAATYSASTWLVGVWCVILPHRMYLLFSVESRLLH